MKVGCAAGVGRVANVRNVGEQPGDPQILVEKSYTYELIVPGRYFSWREIGRFFRKAD